jgi:hypothetical protein
VTKPAIIITGEALAAVLVEENAALAAMDLGRAASLYTRKAAASAAFTDAQEKDSDGISQRLDEEEKRLARELAERLRKLVEENRKLLERGIYVQNNVIGVVARALAQVTPTRQAPRYGASGTIAPQRRNAPFVLSARA